MFWRKSKNKKRQAAPKRASVKDQAPSRLAVWWNALEPQRRREVRRCLVWSLFLVAGALCTAVGLGAMERSVLAGSNGVSNRISLEIMDPPAWMPDVLKRHLEASLKPAAEGACGLGLPEKVYTQARANPWVRSVQSVRRCASDKPGVTLLQVRAQFRKPIARIRTDSAFAYLDAEGVRLPTAQAPHWVGVVVGEDGKDRQICFTAAEEVTPKMVVRPVHYVAIDGVRASEPPVGKVWPGEDVAAGLRLLSLIVDKPYANQITLVDVRNHGGRISRYAPHLKLYAQKGRGKATEIKFGRFPEPMGDSEVPTKIKISNLDYYVERNGGRLAGLSEYLDLQQDQLHVSVN